MNQTIKDCTPQLRSQMQRVGITSFRALGTVAGVSKGQVRLLRQGRADQMQVGSLARLGQALQLSLLDMVRLFSEVAIPDVQDAVPVLQEEPPSQATADKGFMGAEEPVYQSEVNWQQEYQRLQTQLKEQRSHLQQDFQRASLQILESLLLQLPTALHAAQNNPQVPAARLVPLWRPIDHLLKSWGIEAIAPVGSEVPYDPQQHQLMDGMAEPGDRVKVRYTGYLQGETLLYRAKVSP